MTFGLPFLILFHRFLRILENMKYTSRLTYFGVPGLRETIQKPYLFINKSIPFHHSLSYPFFIDSGGGRGLRKRSPPRPGRASKNKAAYRKADAGRPGGPQGGQHGPTPETLSALLDRSGTSGRSRAPLWSPRYPRASILDEFRMIFGWISMIQMQIRVFAN